MNVARFLNRFPAFVRDVSITGGTQAAQGLFSMVGGILVARALGPSGKGAISVLVAIGSMAVLLASLGVHTSSIYFLGRFGSDRDAIISNNYVFGAMGGLVTAAALLVAGFLFKHALLNQIGFGLYLLYLPFVVFNYFNEFARRTVLGEGRVAVYNLPDLLSGGALLFGAGAVLLTFGAHLSPLLLVRVGTEAFISVSLVIYIRRAIGFRFQPSWQLLRRQMRYGIKNYTASLLWTVLLQSDLLLCNHFIGAKQTGIYSVAVSLGLPVTLLANVVGILIFQRVSADSDRAHRIANMNRVMRMLVLIVGSMTLAMAAASHWIVPLVYGRRFEPASQALLLLLPGLFALGLETVLANFLAGEGSPSVVYWAPIAGVILNVGANLYVIPRYGITGAAATSTVGYIVVLVLVLTYYLRSTGSALQDALVFRRRDLTELWRAGSAA